MRDPRSRANAITTLIVAIAAIVMTAMWAMVGASVRFAHEGAVERTRTEAQNVAAAMVDSVSRTLEGVNASFKIVAEKMRAHPGVRPDIFAWSHDIPLLSGGVVQASIVGPDGKLWSTTLTADTPQLDLTDREHVRVHLAGSNPGLFIGRPLVTQTSHMTVIPVSRRVDDADGKFLGIVIFLLPPDRVTNLLQSIDLGPRGVLILAGSDNIIRARLSRDSPDGLTTVGQPLAADASGPMVGKESGFFVRTSEVDGVERLFGFRRLGDHPLVVIAGLDLAAALSGTNENATLDATIAGVATLLLAALAGYLIFEIRRRAAREIELAEERRKLSVINNRLKADVALRREAETRMREAQDILRDAVDSISEAFVIFDAEDRLVMYNEKYRRLHRYTASILTPGTRFEDLLRDGLSRGEYPDAIGRGEEWLARRLHMRRHPAAPVEAPLAGGRWVLISDRRMRNGGTAGLRIDISRLKETEAQLRASEERLNRAQRVAQLGSFERDLRTGGIALSTEAYRLLGLSPEAPLPPLQEVLDRVDPGDRPQFEDAMTAADNGSVPEPLEYGIRCFDGQKKRIHLEMALIRDTDGRPVRRVGTMRDVTELREIELQRRDLEHQLHHAEKLTALGTLAGGIAHDLNNTLLPILALSEMLLQAVPANDGTREDLETIVEAARRGRGLVQQILAFSRKEETTKTRVDIFALAKQSLAMLRATVRSSIRIDAQLAEVPLILGDAGQLQQVIVNLITNAAQAIGTGHGTITVRLAAEQVSVSPGYDQGNGTTIRLSVADTGCGMDTQTIDRVFEPFFTTKGVGEGTGLGLSVVHGIVTAHGGSIDVDSTPGIGSIFTILLPAAEVSEPALPSAAA